MKTVGRIGAVGIEVGLALLLGFVGGRWLDGQLDTAPWFKWLGLFFGLAAGVRSFYQVARRARKAMQSEDQEDKGGPDGQ